MSWPALQTMVCVCVRACAYAYVCVCDCACVCVRARAIVRRSRCVFETAVAPQWSGRKLPRRQGKCKSGLPCTMDCTLIYLIRVACHTLTPRVLAAQATPACTTLFCGRACTCSQLPALCRCLTGTFFSTHGMRDMAPWPSSKTSTGWDLTPTRAALPHPPTA